MATDGQQFNSLIPIHLMTKIRGWGLPLEIRRQLTEVIDRKLLSRDPMTVELRREAQIREANFNLLTHTQWRCVSRMKQRMHCMYSICGSLAPRSHLQINAA